MNQNSLTKLEYYKIIGLLQQKCSSELAKAATGRLSPSVDQKTIRVWQQETSEAVLILRYDGRIPLAGIRDIFHAASLAQKGAILSKDDVGKVRDTLYAARTVTTFFNRKLPYEVPLLLEKISRIIVFKELEKEINQVLDEENQIKDTASDTLWSLRRKKKSLNEKIKSKLEQITKSPNSSKYLQETIITERNGRYVVPVKVEYRQNVPGIVHDQSGSGATLFIEPAAIVELNNDIKKIDLQEQEEITRILSVLSSLIAADAESIRQNLEILVEIDGIHARGLLSSEFDCIEPVMIDAQKISFTAGRHPLISKEDVVPISVRLGYDFDALVITGPNTGGKTVTIKTAGLFALMAQSGLHLPADSAEMGVFETVFCDIGDEQSIEQSLSTFSSHMTNIVNIISHTNNKTLVLLDELGAGTDPTEGANLAIAIIKFFMNKDAKIIATTHYSDLKVFAYNHERVENASVEFDTISLRPTYKLLIGVPGKSNALSIAERLGLDSSIIAEAQSMVSEEDQDVSGLIEKLEKDAFYAERNLEDTKARLADAEKKLQELTLREQSLREREEKIIKKAEQEAYQIIRNAKRETMDKIREIKELLAQDKDLALKQARSLRSALDHESEELYQSLTSHREPEHSLMDKDISAGMEVYVPKFSQKGIVIDVLPEELYIQLGIMKIKINKNEVSLPKKDKKLASGSGVSKIKDEKVMNAKTELDVRGEVIEDAISRVDKYLDDAKIAGLQTVSIIHGKGTGALRTAITDYLKRHPYISKYRLGDSREGGHGVTIVDLK